MTLVLILGIVGAVIGLVAAAWTCCAFAVAAKDDREAGRPPWNY